MALNQNPDPEGPRGGGGGGAALGGGASGPFTGSNPTFGETVFGTGLTGGQKKANRQARRAARRAKRAFPRGLRRAKAALIEDILGDLQGDFRDEAGLARDISAISRRGNARERGFQGSAAARGLLGRSGAIQAINEAIGSDTQNRIAGREVAETQLAEQRRAQRTAELFQLIAGRQRRNQRQAALEIARMNARRGSGFDLGGFLGGASNLLGNFDFGGSGGRIPVGGSGGGGSSGSSPVSDTTSIGGQPSGPYII